MIAPCFVAGRNHAPPQSPPEIKRIYPEEPQEIVSKVAETTMEVSIPMFVIAIKDSVGVAAPCYPATKEYLGVPKKPDTKGLVPLQVKKHVAIEIILNMLIGKSSELYKKLYESELIISELSLEYEFAKTYGHIAITGQSKEPKKVLEELIKEINNLKQNGIQEENFKRIKNMIYGDYVKEYNNVSDICRMFVADYFKGINSFDYIEEAENIQITDIEQVLNEVFKEEKIAISIVKNKE